MLPVMDRGSTSVEFALGAVVGIVLGVGSVVATLGLIDGGRQQATRFFETTGGILKMRIDNQSAQAAERSATEKHSKGLTYQDAEILKRDGKNLSLVEPTAR